MTDVIVPNAGEREMVKLGFFILKQSGLLKQTRYVTSAVSWLNAQKIWLMETLLFNMPFELQLAVCVVLKLSVSVPVNMVGLFTPVHESGQLKRKQRLKLMAPVFVQEDKLLMVTVTDDPLLVTTIQPGRLAVQLAS